MLWYMVKVGYGENHLLSSFVDSVVLYPTKLTTIVRSLKYPHPYLLPIRRVAVSILWLDWHILFLHHFYKLFKCLLGDGDALTANTVFVFF